MTVPSREEVARAIAEKRYDRVYANSLRRVYANSHNTETIVGHLDDAARAGFPALIGTTHEECDPEECHDGKRWSPDGPMCSENGILGWYDCPDGRPVYWTVSDD